MSILFPHNQTAYEAVLSMLDQYGKACVIHPTGTGKSFIGFQYAVEHPEERIIWLAPSGYIYETQLENWKRAGGTMPGNISFYTYAKLTILTPNELEELKPDTILADEMHRTGASVWGAATWNVIEKYPEAKLIGLTATNIRYLDNQRDMAQELFDGHVASEMSLGEAIVRGILPAPKYVLSIFKYKDDLEKYELRAKRTRSKATRDAAEEIIEQLRRALENAVGMDALFEKHMTEKDGKYLVFCANYEHMTDMMGFVSEWFEKVDPHPHVYSAYSDDPSTSQAFADFKSDHSEHLKLLFCIDMLNEGIHVDDVSGVILLRPTVSPIIYKQQIGRALSSSSTKAPVIFDIVMNIENLYSISSIQEEMEIATAYYRSLGENDSLVEEFEVIDEVHECMELFDRLNETLTATWDIMYEQAKKYYQENGDLNVALRYITPEGYTLGFWIQTQRRVRRGVIKGVLTPTQIQLLDQLGMRWESVTDRNWERYYSAAKKYSEEHGDLLVPWKYVTEDGIHLANWIVNMRINRKNGIRTGYLTEERIKALDDLGMQWDVLDYLFEKNFAAAVEYHRTYGDLNVPVEYVDPDGNRLGAWMARLRMVNAGKIRGSLSPEQIDRLNQLGMVWGNRNDIRWNEGYQHAVDYYAQHGNLMTYPSYRAPDGYKLGGWVDDQREKYNAGKMKQERFEKLEKLGMQWTLPEPWEYRYSIAQQYYKEHGNLEVPANYKVGNISLTKWLDEQRQARKGKREQKLTDDQIRRLDEIGMIWEKTVRPVLE